MFMPPAPQGFTSAASPARYCSHCGQGLQAAWTHCPQCGAPVTR
ncbi:MAG: zinc-ribbon domain-containing protein [Chloroflexi bacterium]|nr:zinc-ribbon domain-containing protein [Chloroflexota bacterium]